MDVWTQNHRQGGVHQSVELELLPQLLHLALHTASSCQRAVEGSRTDQTGRLECSLPRGGGDVSEGEVVEVVYVVYELQLGIRGGVRQVCGGNWQRSLIEQDLHVEMDGDWQRLATAHVHVNVSRCQTAGLGHGEVWSAGRGSARSRHQ